MKPVSTASSVYVIVVGAIAAIQGVVVGTLGVAGYFYLDDIDMTAEGAKHPFDWAYLSMSLNDHFTPGLRSVFWAIAHFAPYDNGATVFGRVMVQFVATLLVAYLLALLVGPGRLAMLGVALYAFSPLLIPSLLSLSSGVNLLPTHVGILVLTIMHVRFHMTRKYRYAILGAIGLLLGLLFWEKAVLGLMLPVLLTFLYLTSGGLGPRFAALRQDWAAWLIYSLPTAWFFWYYLTGGYPKSGSYPRIGDVWTVFGESWLHSVGPTVIGGPWHWNTIATVYYSAAWPRIGVTLLGQAALLAVAVIGIRRNGWSSLRAWLIVALYLLGSAILLVAGRFEYIGLLLTRNFHYYSEVAIPLVLAIVLSLGAPTVAAIRARSTRGPFTETFTETVVRETGTPTGWTRPVRIGAVLAVLAYAVSYGVTVAAFEKRWIQNPIRPYMTNAIRDVNALTAQHGISIYDTFSPYEVAPLIQGNRRVSDIFRPVIRDLEHPVVWDDASKPMYTFDRQGHLVKATLVLEALSPVIPGEFCTYRLKGMGSVTVRLDNRITRPDGYLVLDYLAESQTQISIKLADGETMLTPRRNGEADLIGGKYAAVAVPTPDHGFDRVVITGTDPKANVCLSARAGYAAAEGT